MAHGFKDEFRTKAISAKDIKTTGQIVLMFVRAPERARLP